MRSLDQWLSEYAESHRNPTNKRLHYWCVPAIQLAVLGLLWALPVPAALGPRSLLVSWASLAMLAALIYYALLSVRLAVGMLLCTLAMFAVLGVLAQLGIPLWLSCAAIFVIAWIGQFIGHALEGQRPSFFKDLQFLLIGPLWLLAAAYRRLSVPY